MQIGQTISSNQNDALSNFYGFSSNNKKNNILQQYEISINSLTLNKFKPDSSINYLLDQFVKKNEQLATRAIEFGPKTNKVPSSNIFIYEGDMTIDNQTLPTTQSSTIIIKNGNLLISGSIPSTNIYIVPDGNIIFANGCDEDQHVYGVLITKNKLLSDKNYSNTNLVGTWCK
jgi:hypothetical protein